MLTYDIARVPQNSVGGQTSEYQMECYGPPQWNLLATQCSMATADYPDRKWTAWFAL